MSHGPEPSGRVVRRVFLDWTVAVNMVDALFCATLRGCRGGHTPLCTGRNGNNRHRCGGGWTGPRLFLGGSFQGGGVPVSGIEVRSLVGLCAHYAFHWWSAHCAARMLLLLEKLMSYCAAGTNGCLDLRRCAAAPDGRVSAEWSRCPGSMARRTRDSVAPLRRSSAGWMPARIGSLSAGVGRRHPVTVRNASLIVRSIRRVWALRHQTGAQYSAVEWTRARVAVRSVVAPAPQPEPASRLRSAMRDVSFLRSYSRCRRYVSDLSNVTPRYLGSEQKGRVSLLKLTFSSRLASLSLRWKTADPFSWCWALASKSGGIHLVLPCPCSVPLPLPANLHQHAWLLGRQHMRTFWRWWLAGHRCRCWQKGRQERSLWDAVLEAS